MSDTNSRRVYFSLEFNSQTDTELKFTLQCSNPSDLAEVMYAAITSPDIPDGDRLRIASAIITASSMIIQNMVEVDNKKIDQHFITMLSKFQNGKTGSDHIN